MDASGADGHVAFGFGEQHVCCGLGLWGVALFPSNQSGRYEDPGLSIVVAVNLLSRLANELAVGQALFGSLAVHSLRDGPSAPATTVRQQDGFWMRESELLVTRVFAALAGTNIDPGSFASRCPTLWLHPWATHRLEPSVPSSRGIGGRAAPGDIR